MGKLGLGPVGLAVNVSDGYRAEAAEAERLGYSAIWLPGGQIDKLSRLADLVRATKTVPVASAIIPLDVYPADVVAGFCAELEATAPGRFLPGIGGPQVPRPLQPLGAYLDDLDRANPPVPAGRRLLAALGPGRCGSCPACPATAPASPGWGSARPRSPGSATGSSTSWSHGVTPVP